MFYIILIIAGLAVTIYTISYTIYFFKKASKYGIMTEAGTLSSVRRNATLSKPKNKRRTCYKVKCSDEYMCMKIKQLNGMTVEDVLNRYWTRNVVPIDISEILYSMDIRVVDMDFTDVEETLQKPFGDILGAVVAKGDMLAIMYKQNETLNRTRFTLAHELAHCCLKHITPEQHKYIEYRSAENCDTVNEVEANIFAGALLIPERELGNALKQYFPTTFPSSELLATIFAVSVNVMEERLKYLKIPFIDKNNRKIVCLE